MLFLRISDSAEIKGKDEIIQFTKNKRKGNKIIKFTVTKDHENVDDAFKFFYEVLTTRMIPKKSLNILSEHPIKVVVTATGNVLAFQDLDCRINFLVLDDITGKVEKKTFDNLLAQEDSIICGDDGDWYLDDVDSTFVMYYDGEFDDDGEAEEIAEGIEDDEFVNMELSNYIISSENGGLIINNIFVT